MSPYRLGTTAVVAVVGAVLTASPAFAYAEADPVVTGWTADRAWATSAAFLAALGALVAGAALTRWVRAESVRRRMGVIGVIAGVVALVNGAVNMLVADGGPGTGNGVVGGFLAVVVGAVAIGLGWVARRRRAAVS